MMIEEKHKIRYNDANDEDDDDDDNDDDDNDDDDYLQSHMLNKLRQLDLSALVLVH